MGTISPVLISAAAALTLVGVRRLRRPNCQTSLVFYRFAIDILRSYIVIFSPYPGSSWRRSWYVGQFLPGGELGGIGVEGNGCGGLVEGEEVFDLSQSTLRCRSTVRHGEHRVKIL